MTFSRAVRVSAPAWLLSLVWLAATPAIAAPPASIDWLIEPSQTVLTLGGQLGTAYFPSAGLVDPLEDPNNPGNPWILEIYNAEPQKFAGTSGDPNGANINSTLSSAVGRFSSTGTTFLSSLNLGPQPPGNKPIGEILTSMTNNGNWVPTSNSPNTISPGNAAFAIGPNGSNGRVRLYGMAGDFTSNNASTAVTMAGDFNSATFNTNFARITGTLGINLFYQGNEFSQSAPFDLTPPNFINLNGGLGTLSNDINNATAGFYTRNGADYLMHAAFLDVIEIGLAQAPTGIPESPWIGWVAAISLQVDFVAKANIRPGDVNFDGVVDIADTLTVGANWLQTGAFRPGNANGDGVVDIADVLTIGANWLQTTPPLPGGGAGGPDASPVPEPASLVILGLGLVGLLTCRRLRR